MLKRLIEFVTSDTAQPHYKLTLQDISLCQLWYDSQHRQGARNESMAAIQRRIESWLANPDEPDLNTAGRRHQGLLRLLLTHLERGRLGMLAADEVAFLCVACGLVKRCAQQETQSRFSERLEGHELPLLELQQQNPPTSDLHQLEMHIRYATEADIKGAEVTSIRLLAGIELPCRGPLFTAGNHLRILGDVPENCTVEVKNEGSCSVDGYVMGRILTKGHCEIRQNISGVAIVLDGHVRARSIINNALVVSKMGEVVCNNAQGPKLVFAGRSIHIRESTMMGKFIARDLEVGEEARGSHIEIAGTAEAKRFRNLGMSNMVIVLRRELSCEDFGEITGDELKHLLSKAYSLRRNARNFQGMADAARREAEHTAQSVLMFLFGGGEVQKRLKGFLDAQRRHAIISSVVDNLQRILERAQDGLVSVESSSDVESPVVPGANDLEQDEELREARMEAEKLQKTLRRHNMDLSQKTLLLEEVRQKLAKMLELRQGAVARMQEEERSIQYLEKYNQLLAGSGEGATKLDVLNKILPALKEQAPDSVIGKRLRSSFIVRALRTVDRTTGHEAEFDIKANEYIQDFRAVSERLGKDYQIRVLENPDSKDDSGRVTGVFDAGTRIYMDVFVENLSDAPTDAVITTDQDDGVRTYVRAGTHSGFHRSDHH